LKNRTEFPATRQPNFQELIKKGSLGSIVPSAQGKNGVGFSEPLCIVVIKQDRHFKEVRYIKEAGSGDGMKICYVERLRSLDLSPMLL